MNKEVKVRFFRWKGGPDSGSYFLLWKIRRDGSAEGMGFNGKKESREKGNFVWQSLDSVYFKDEGWEEITEAEAALII